MTLRRAEWDAIQNTMGYLARFLEDRRENITEYPQDFRVAMEVLYAELERWRTGSPGELIVVCKAHRRRCDLETPGEFGGARIRHVNPVTGARGDLCFSQRHLVRWEYDLDRMVILDELVPAFVRQ